MTPCSQVKIVFPTKTALFALFVIEILLLSGAFFTPAYAQESAPPHTVSVSAGARARVPAAAAIITFSIYAKGATASEADAAAERVRLALEKSISNPKIKESLTLRGATLTSAAQARAPISPNTAVAAQRFLSVETEVFSEIPSIVDKGIAAGAKEAEVEYLIPDSGEALEQASALASSRAKEKAAKAAAALGAKLGDIVELSISEELPGSVLRRQLQAGTDVGRYSERYVTVYATAKFLLLN